MMKLSISAAAFCLHSRAYRENSLIVHIFAEHVGRMSAVAKGVKGPAKKNGGIVALLQPFVPVQMTFTGKSELKTLVSVEPCGQPYVLSGQALFAGLYLNELLMRLLTDHLDHPEIYQHYQQTLASLQQTEFLEPPLRHFERRILECLGYGIPFVEVDEAGHQTGSLQEHLYYRFVPDAGFVPIALPLGNQSAETLFSGEQLVRIAGDLVQEKEVAAAAKRLMRQAIAPLLDGKPLNSKRLFC